MARFETLDASPEVEQSKRFIVEELDERMKDPAFRASLAGKSFTGDARQLLPVLNMYEQMGNYVRHGYIDKEFVLDSYANPVVSVWKHLRPVLPYLRYGQGQTVAVWLEYLAALSQPYMEADDESTYPSDVPHMPLDTSLFDADKIGR